MLVIFKYSRNTHNSYLVANVGTIGVSGLKGILEKDFVMMKGLKHDLNKKLADMKANIGTVSNFTIVLSVSCIFSFLSQ